MDRIIEQLLSPDTDVIKQATRDLAEAFQQPGAVETLCTVMANHTKAEVRQYAAVLLRRKLEKQSHYQQVPAVTLSIIKQNLLNAIFIEKERLVRSAMTQFLGCVLRHEQRADDTIWVDNVIQFIAVRCTSNDAETVENAAFVMTKLADETPELFVQRFSAVGALIQRVLLSSNGSFKLSTTVMYNILSTMSALVPELHSNEAAQKTYQEAVPHLVQLKKYFADLSEISHFSIGLEVVEGMIEYTPWLLVPHLRLLIDFALGISSNKNYEGEIRIKTLIFFSFLVTVKKKLLLKLQLIEQIIGVVFEIMASEPESDDADEFFDGSDSNTILAAANVVVNTLAVNMPTEKFIPPLLSLIEPALQNFNDDLRRRSAYIVLATISEGCREAICNKYLKSMVDILKKGLSDPVLSVRSAAFFAIGQFSEQLQPKIADYANDILPILLNCLQDVLRTHRLDQKIDEKLVERLFYALEAFCENIDKGLTPFIEILMTVMLNILNSNFPQRLNILVLGLIESAAKAYKGSLLPWAPTLIAKLRLSLWQPNPSDIDGLLSQALNTLAATARNIEQQFRPFAQETLEKSVQMFEATSDQELRKALLNIFGALASVVGEEMSTALPVVLHYIECCLSKASNLTQQGSCISGIADAKSNEIEFGVTSSDEELESDEQLSMGENPYLQSKDQAVFTLKDFLENCPRSLLPYNQKLFELLFKLIDHPCSDLRGSSISAAKTLVIKWYEQDAAKDHAKQAAHILLPKLIETVQKEFEKDVVVEALDAIGDILAELECDSLPNKSMGDLIVKCISDGLNYKYLCQFASSVGHAGDGESHNEYDSESDRAVVEGAANLLTTLANAVSTVEYVAYFKQVEPLLMKHFNSTTIVDLQSTRTFIISVLAECYAPLGKEVAPYYTEHLKILIRGAQDCNEKTKQNAIFAIGELVRMAGDVSFGSFPLILNILSNIVKYQRKRVVVDNVVCTLAQLILTNADLVPLEYVLPAMLEMLPIVDIDVDNNVVFECFIMIFNKMPEQMLSHIGRVVTIAIQTISKPHCDSMLIDFIICLIRQIRTIYPDHYQAALRNPLLSPLLPVAQEQVGDHL